MNNLNNDLIALKLAGLEVCRIENEKYKSFELADITIPDDVDRRITKLIDAYETKKEIKSTLIRVACIVIAVLVVGGAILTVNVEAREKLLKFLRKDYGSSIEYVPSRNESAEVELNQSFSFEVKWLPEGYELSGLIERDGWSRMIFESIETDDAIIIGVYPIGKFDVFGFSFPEGVDVVSEEGNYNGLHYEYISANSSSKANTLLVIDDIKNCYCTIDSTLEREVIFKLFDNIIID